MPSPRRPLLAATVLTVHGGACWIGGCFLDGAGEDAAAGGAPQSTTVFMSEATTGTGGAGGTGSVGGGGDGAGGATPCGEGGAGGAGACAVEAGLTCDDAPTIVLAGDPVLVVGTTETAMMSFDASGVDGLSCDSAGPDAWVRLVSQVPGTVRLRLSVPEGGGFGGSEDHAVLVVRKGGCDRHVADTMFCGETEPGPPGNVATEFFLHPNVPHLVGVDGDSDTQTGIFELEILHDVCGDKDPDPPEQCDPPDPITTCSGCVMTTGMAGLADCGDSVPGATSAVWDGVEKRCYAFVPEAGTFYEARQKCVAAGGDLVSYDEGQVPNAVLQPFPDATSWIGAAAWSEPTFTWLTDMPVMQMVTADVAADELRCVTTTHLGVFADEPCSQSNVQSFICELRLGN